MPGGKREDLKPGWIHGALLIAFAGGALAGFVGHAGLTAGFQTASLALATTGLVLLAVASFLVRQSLPGDGDHIPLPGEVYQDAKPPNPMSNGSSDLGGRVPFRASKGVVERSSNSQADDLHKRLAALNQALQRANVKLGLGELSSEGYTRVVEEIKSKRAEVEHRLTQHGER